MREMEAASAKQPHCPAAGKCPQWYEISSGETLTTIAQKCGMTIITLQTLNPGINPDALTVGQVIKTSSSANAVQSPALTSEGGSNTGGMLPWG